MKNIQFDEGTEYTFQMNPNNPFWMEPMSNARNIFSKEMMAIHSFTILPVLFKVVKKRSCRRKIDKGFILTDTVSLFSFEKQAIIF